MHAYEAGIQSRREMPQRGGDQESLSGDVHGYIVIATLEALDFRQMHGLARVAAPHEQTIERITLVRAQRRLSHARAVHLINPFEKKLWGIQGVAVKRGVWQPGVAWSDGQARLLVQDNPGNGTRLRIKYYAITPNHFLWRADGSRDGGRSWLRDVILIEATRSSFSQQPRPD